MSGPLRSGPLVAALSALFMLAACERPLPPPEPPRPVLTRVVGESTGGQPTGASPYAGEIRSRHETPLAFRIGGKLLERPVDVGATVRPGELLARLDPVDPALSASAAEAQLALAEAEARRYRELRTQNFVSQAALDARETTLRAMRAQAELARNQRAYTELRADRAGVVAAVAAEPGQVVGAGQTVLRLARPDTPEVLIALPESRIAGLRVGRAAEITLWAETDARYRGVLRELSPVADAATRTYAARISLLEPDARVRLGMTASVRFEAAAAEPSPLTVPLTSVFQHEGRPALWVVDADSIVRLRPVEVLAWGETAATLASGVAAGERIVEAGVHKLVAGERIRIATAAAR